MISRGFLGKHERLLTGYLHDEPASSLRRGTSRRSCGLHCCKQSVSTESVVAYNRRRASATILPAGVGHEASACFAIHEDSQLAIRVLVPPPCGWISFDVGGGKEEPKTAIVQLLRSWRVWMPQDGLNSDGVQAVGRNDYVRLGNLTAGKCY
jgi:hypothetical protein